MASSDHIFSLINKKYASFSKTYKAISDFIYVNYSIVSFLTVHELSDRTGVSAASIVRFCQELGYSGYQALQRDIQLLVQSESTPMLEIRTSISDVDNDPLKEMLKFNIVTLQNTYNESLAIQFPKAIEAVSTARNVYILGLRSSYTVAYYASFLLSQFMDNVVLLSAGTDDIYDRLACSGKEDVLIAISFSRYTRFTLQVTEFLKGRGLTIVTVTDRPSAPIARQADVTLLAKNSSKTFSFVSAMTILNALVVAVGRRDAERTMLRLNEKEEIARKMGVYL